MHPSQSPLRAELARITKETSHHRSSNSHSAPNEHTALRNPIFILPNKERTLVRKRIKVTQKQAPRDSLDSQVIKRQLDGMRSHESQAHQVHPLQAMLRQFGLTDEHSSAKMQSKNARHHPSQKLKPITSQTHIEPQQPQFLSVEKMELLGQKKHTKAKSFLFPSQEPTTAVLRSSPSATRNRLLKDMLTIKERMQARGMLSKEEIPIHSHAPNRHKRGSVGMQTVEVKYEPLERAPSRKMTNPVDANSTIRDTATPSTHHKMITTKDQFRPRARDRIVVLSRFQKPSLPQLEAKSLQDREALHQHQPPSISNIGNSEIEPSEKMDLGLTEQKNLAQGICFVRQMSLSEKKAEGTERQKIGGTVVVPRRHSKKFTAPFETYHYRDLIWKVNYSNYRIVEPPLQYEHRIKVFVGRGNNSYMVKALISRRQYLALTERIDDAHFVWTQLKHLPLLNKQSSCQPIEGKLRGKAKYKAESILTDIDAQAIRRHMVTQVSAEERNDERLLARSKLMDVGGVIKGKQITENKLHNHLINNYVLGNKKALFNTMAAFYASQQKDVFDYLPLTFHIKDGIQDKKYFEFLRYYHKRNKDIAKRVAEGKKGLKQHNAWIVKPGQNSNRGQGIKMCLNLDDIKTLLKKRQRYNDGTFRTHIVQAYIERPLLYHRRKFDIRHFIMMTCVNGCLKGYWYRHGYYTLAHNSGAVHLTNDAVQKNLADYGKFQKGNKLSYDDLSAYIEKHHGKKDKGFYPHIYPRMKQIATDAMKACSGAIDPARLSNNFEIFGMDFMIDSQLDVWLIEINTNPCLELSCPLLGCIVPKMLQNALELTLDAAFPPPVRYSPKGVHYFKDLEKENKFQLVYDQRMEVPFEGSLAVIDSKLLQEQDDTFEDDGDQDWEDM